MKSIKQARAAGFVIDESAAGRPYAYKGPRFQPTEGGPVQTEYETELMHLLEEARGHLLVAGGDGRRTAQDLVSAINRKLEEIRRTA